MDYGKELFEIMGKVHKLTYQARMKGNLPQGEFMMLLRIEHFTGKQKEAKDDRPGIKVSELSQILKSNKSTI